MSYPVIVFKAALSLLHTYCIKSRKNKQTGNSAQALEYFDSTVDIKCLLSPNIFNNFLLKFAAFNTTVIFFNQEIQQIRVFPGLGMSCLSFCLSWDQMHYRLSLLDFVFTIVVFLWTKMSQGNASLTDERRYMDLGIQILRNYKLNPRYTLIAFLSDYRVQHWRYGMAY